MKIKNLHDFKDWENYYTRNIPLQIKNAGVFTSYDIYLCDYLIANFIPKYKGKTGNKPIICEIGSGDGKLVKKIGKMMGYEPFGIEYSKEAAELSKRNGVKVLYGNAFKESNINKLRNKFDVVFSYGFIEHIIPPEKAIKIHIDMLKPGGYLIVQIPRFKGFNFLRLKIFRPDLIKNHNLDIMNEDVLEKLCSTKEIEKIYCKNYGTFKLRLPMENKNLKYYILKGICLLDYVLNPTFRILFGTRGFETYLFSPAVIFIGRKRIKR